MNATPQQLKLLRFITAYDAENGYPPSYAEMARHMGLAKSGINRLLGQLEWRGHIRRTKHATRSIEIVSRPSLGAPVPIPNIDIKNTPSPALIGLRALIDCELKERRVA